MNELNQKIKLLIHLAQLCGDIRVYIRRGNTRMVKSELDMFLFIRTRKDVKCQVTQLWLKVLLNLKKERVFEAPENMPDRGSSNASKPWRKTASEKGRPGATAPRRGGGCGPDVQGSVATARWWRCLICNGILKTTFEWLGRPYGPHTTSFGTNCIYVTSGQITESRWYTFTLLNERMTVRAFPWVILIYSNLT